MFTTDLVNLYNRNIFKTSLYIYIFQDEKCRLMRNLSLSMSITHTNVELLIYTKRNKKKLKINEIMYILTFPVLASVPYPYSWFQLEFHRTF